MKMKKHILICIFFAFLCTNLFAQQEVALEEIKTASAHYLSAYNPDRTLYNVFDISSVSYIPRQGKPAIYEVLFQNGNTVLLSGSKACLPVLGCNFSGKGETIVNNDDLPPGLQAMLDGMLMDIDSALLNDTITLYYQAEWNELMSADFIEGKNTRVQKGPLLTSVWDQRYSNDNHCDAYNHYVEKTSQNCGCASKRCPAGCVAVAMAQILYYWKYPWNRGVYTYYDWCNMPDSLLYNKGNNPRYEIERNAVAKLIYDCGVLVGMEYCDGGCSSSAATKDARDVFVYNFLYSSDADFRRKFWWSDSKWKGFIKSDINNGRPIMYRGEGSGGHAFVCDGYTDGDLFHFNWGWRGSQNNLWLTVDNITPGGSNYSKKQKAIFEIHPDNNLFVNYCNAQVNLPAIYAVCAANGITDFWNIVPHTGKILESCDQSLPAAWRTIPSGESSTYTAFDRVVLKPGFTAKAGSHFVASIRECPNCENRNPSILSVITDETSNETTDSNDDATPLSTKSLQVEASGKEVILYPNPNSGTFQIDANFPLTDIFNFKIMNLLGVPIYETQSLTSNTIQVPISASGHFFVVMILKDGSVLTQKIVIQR